MGKKTKKSRAVATHASPAKPPDPPAPFNWKWSEKWDGAIVVLVALLARALYLLQIRATDPFYGYTIAGFDQHTYQRMAHDILAGDILLRSWKLFYYGPLYGYFCAIVYWIGGENNFDLLHVIQAAIGVASCWLLWAVARRYLGRGEALVAGVIAAIAQLWLFYEQLLLMEGIILFLNVLFFLFLRDAELGGRYAGLKVFGAGIATALSYVGRGSFALLLAAFPIWIFFRLGIFPATGPPSRRRGIVLSLLFIFGAILILIPVTWRNWAVSNRLFIGTTNGPAMLYLGNATDGDYPGEFDYSPRFSLALDKSQGDPAIYGKMLREDLRQHSGAILFNLLRKTHYFWNGYDMPDNTSLYLGKLSSPLLRWNPATMEVFIVLGLLGLALSWRSWKDTSLLWLFMILFSASIIIIVPVGRYKLPITIPLIIFSARALGWARTSIQQRSFGQLTAALAGAALLAAIAYPFKSPRIRMNDYWNFITTGISRGKAPLTVPMIDRAFKDYPNNLEPHLFRFEYFVRTGAWNEARAYRKVLLGFKVALPEFTNISFARILLHDGEIPQAVALLKEILKAKPDSAQAKALLEMIESPARPPGAQQ